MTTDPRDFLRAIYGPNHTAPIDGHDAEGEFAFTLEDFPDNDGTQMVLPDSPQGMLSYVYAVDHDVDPNAWKNETLPPTAVLAKTVDGKTSTITFWATEAAVEKDVLAPVAASLGMNVDESHPIDGTGDWKLIHSDPDVFYTHEQLLETFAAPEAGEGGAPVEQAVAEEPEAAETPGFWRGARLCPASYDPEQDLELHKQFVICLGNNKDSKRWEPKPMNGVSLYATLANHTVGKKDGPGYVGGELVGSQRKANAVKALYVLSLDIDAGLAIEEIVKRVEASGVKAFIYTTFSHMKDKTDFAQSKVLNFAKEQNLDFEDDADEIIRQLMKSQNYEAPVYESATCIGTEHTEEGVMVSARTIPIPKARVVMVLKEAYVISEQGTDQKTAIAKWKKFVLAAGKLLDLPIDVSGVDPSRLLYLSRHAKGRPYETVVVGGDHLLDWRALDLDDGDDALANAAANLGGGDKPKSKSRTPEGRALGEWWVKRAVGSQLADLIQDLAPDRVRAAVASGLEIECPHDENHSNPGDPDDRACLVSNQGDFNPDYPTWVCQHESCRAYTPLDHIGRALKDGWFTEDALWSETYNAAEGLEGKSGVEIAKTMPSPTEEDALRLEIKALPKAPSSVLLQPVLDKIKGYKGSAKASLLKLLNSTTGVSIKDLRSDTKTSASKSRSIKRIVKNDETTLKYYGDFDELEMISHVLQVFKDRNVQADGKLVPAFTWRHETMMRMVMLDGKIYFESMSSDKALAKISKYVSVVRQTDAGDGFPKTVPKDTFRIAYNTAQDHLPPTPELFDTPFLSKSMDLIFENGWHEDENVYLKNSVELPPRTAAPPPERVKDALHILNGELLGEYHLLDARRDEKGRRVESRDPSAHNALGFLLSYFVKNAINGPTPIFMVSKPEYNCGGTFLVQMINLAATGREAGLTTYTENEAELGKIFVSMLLSQPPCVFFDDIVSMMSQTMKQTATATRMTQRILGGNNRVDEVRKFLIAATGINPKIPDEMERRICWIRMNPKMPQEEPRVYQKELKPWILENRMVIVDAVMVLIENWIAKGRPLFKTRKLDSYEHWGQIVGGIIEAAMPNHSFLSNHREKGANEDDAAEREFVRDLYVKLTRNPSETSLSIRAAADHAINNGYDIVPSKGDDNEKRKHLFRMFQRFDGRVFLIAKSKKQFVLEMNDEGTSMISFVHMDEDKIAVAA